MAAPLPLDGVRVLDFSTLLPGPLATLILQTAGADVVKVERPPHGDPLRDRPRQFALLNSGKESVAVDLKSASGLEQIEPFIRAADVLVEGFRPGVMRRLGLGYQDVSRTNPGVVYCSISGYGQTGARRLMTGHDLNYVGHSGVLHLRSYPDTPSAALPAGLMADVGCGSYPAVINILLALLRRHRTGLGGHLDVAMAENVFPFAFWALAPESDAELQPGAGRLTGASPRYQSYTTADGRLALVAPLEDKLWERFCDVVAVPDPLRDDARDPSATIAACAEVIRGRDSEHWRDAFAAADCSCTIAATVEEAMGDPAFRARGLFSNRGGDEAPTSEPVTLPVPVDASLSRSRDDTPPA
jgi:alpha-methylacyl-CoA racemase